MELVRNVTPAAIELRAVLRKTLVAGEKLKTEVGEEELSEVCPDGKEWLVRLSLAVQEVDA